MGVFLANLIFVLTFLLSRLLASWPLSFWLMLALFAIIFMALSKARQARFGLISALLGLLWAWFNLQGIDGLEGRPHEHLQKGQNHLYQAAVLRLSSLDQPVFGWLVGLLLGDGGYLAGGLLKVSQHLGLVHLLVVSGLHITVFSALFSRLLIFPISLFYVFNPHSQTPIFIIKKIAIVSGLVFGWWYCWFVGSGPAAQRAMILHTVFACGRMGYGVSFRSRSLVLAATVQILMFPNDFFSFGSLFSWGVYLIIIFHNQSSWGWCGSLILQAKIVTFASLMLGSFSIYWVIIGCLVGFFSSPILISAWLIFLTPDSSLGEVCISLHNFLLDFLFFCFRSTPAPMIVSDTQLYAVLSVSLVAGLPTIWHHIRIPYSSRG